MIRRNSLGGLSNYATQLGQKSNNPISYNNLRMQLPPTTPQ